MTPSLIFIFPNRTSSILDKLISLWEGGHRPFHVGILCLNPRNEQIVLQADPDGNFVVPLSYYDANPTKIIAFPAYLDFDYNETYAYFSKIKYSYEGAAEAGLAQYLHWLPFLKTKKKYCSQACAEVLRQAGFPLPTTELDPYRLLQIMTNK